MSIWVIWAPLSGRAFRYIFVGLEVWDRRKDSPRKKNCPTKDATAIPGAKTDVSVCYKFVTHRHIRLKYNQRVGWPIKIRILNNARPILHSHCFESSGRWFSFHKEISTKGKIFVGCHHIKTQSKYRHSFIKKGPKRSFLSLFFCAFFMG